MADYIRVFNDRGFIRRQAELSNDVLEGLAVANLGYWPGLSRNGSGSEFDHPLPGTAIWGEPAVSRQTALTSHELEAVI